MMAIYVYHLQNVRTWESAIQEAANREDAIKQSGWQPSQVIVCRVWEVKE